MEDLKPLSTHGWLEIGQARYATAWPRKARDKAITDRVGDLHKDNRYSFSHALEGCQCWGISGKVIRRQVCKFLCKSVQALNIARSPAIIDLNVPAVCPSKFLEPVLKHFNIGTPVHVAFGEYRQHTDAPHSLALLCARRERPRCRRAAEQRDELAPSSFDHLVGAREYSSLILIRRYRQARVTHGADVASGFPFSTT